MIINEQKKQIALSLLFYIKEEMSALNLLLKSSKGQEWCNASGRFSGFFETYDILLSFELKNTAKDKGLVYSIYNDVWYPGIEHIAALKHIKQYMNFETTFEDISFSNSKLVKLGGIFIWEIQSETLQNPKKWLDLLKKFYSKYCRDEETLNMLLDFVLLTITSLLYKAPIIIDSNILIDNNEYLVVGYHLSETYKRNVQMSGQQISLISIDFTEIAKRIKENVEDNFSFLMSTLETNHLCFEDFEKLNKDFLKINFNTEENKYKFDYVFLIPKYLLECGVLMPALFNLLLSHVFRFPFLINNTSWINEEDEIFLRKVVNEEFEAILFYLFQKGDKIPILLNNIVY